MDSFRVIEHRDRVPRTILGTKRAADTAFDIDFDKLLELDVGGIRNDFNTIHRAERNASLTTRAAVLVNDSQEMWFPLPRQLVGN